jgi:nucleoside-diphosphate-sugar epimerase
VKALVTGGNGFLGGAIVRQLRERGWEVTAASRATGLDITDAAAVRVAVEGMDVVFHAAARAGVWGPREDFRQTNVVGTQNVLDACVAGGVPRLVYTSSPSVVFDGRDHLDAGNDLPYPSRFEAFYPESKAEAERRVRAADSPRLATVCLRPHLIWGPGDPHLLPRLFARAKAGRLRVVGPGDNRVSITFVENAAAAHVQALGRLSPGAACAGGAYFVNDAEPVLIWAWLAELMQRLDLPKPGRAVPLAAARAAGAVLEWAWRTFGLRGEPPMTRFVATQLATSHTYSLVPAARDLGYQPVVDAGDALARTVEWWRGRV